MIDFAVVVKVTSRDERFSTVGLEEEANAME